MAHLSAESFLFIRGSTIIPQIDGSITAASCKHFCLLSNSQCPNLQGLILVSKSKERKILFSGRRKKLGQPSRLKLICISNISNGPLIIYNRFQYHELNRNHKSSFRQISKAKTRLATGCKISTKSSIQPVSVAIN